MRADTVRLKAVLEDMPLQPTIGAALILGLALPASLVAWHEADERGRTLFDTLARETTCVWSRRSPTACRRRSGTCAPRPGSL